MSHEHVYATPTPPADLARGIEHCETCGEPADRMIGRMGAVGAAGINIPQGRFRCDPVTGRILERLSPLEPPKPEFRTFSQLPPVYSQVIGLRVSVEDWRWLVARAQETGQKMDKVTEDLFADAVKRASSAAVTAGV